MPSLDTCDFVSVSTIVVAQHFDQVSTILLAIAGIVEFHGIKIIAQNPALLGIKFTLFFPHQPHLVLHLEMLGKKRPLILRRPAPNVPLSLDCLP